MTRLNIPLFVALAASILCAIDARDQLPHQRMIRKRSALPRMQVEERAPAFVVPRWEIRQNNAGSSSSSASAVSTSAAASSSAAASTSKEASTSAAATSSVATSSAVQTSSVVTTSSAASTSSGGLLDGLTSVLLSQSSTTVSTTSSIASTSSVSSSSSAIAPSTSSVAQTTSQAAAPAPSPTTQPTLNLATEAPSATARSASFVVVSVTSNSPAEASVVAEEKAKKTAKITRNTIISLVVVASCIGGAVAIWTVIRKWKLSPSERFDDRMQPIDWAPTGGAGAHDVPVDEKRHGRTGSTGSHGSFTSGAMGQSETGHAARSVYSGAGGHGAGATQYGAQPAQDFPPAHDFTAGGAQYYQGQQYAGGGYADLQRGASVSESSYSHGGAGVTRGMSFSRGPAGYEAQPGGAVPPMPNPYGGGFEYEEYERQAAPGPVQVQGQGQYRGY